MSERIDRLVEHIRRVVQDGSWPVGAVLNRTSMQVRFRESEWVVQEAVLILRQQGVLEMRPGVGVRPKQQGRTWRRAECPHLKWVRTATVVRERITAGRYRPGDCIPPARALAAELGAHYQTVRTGLLHLEEEGLLTRSGTRWCVAGAPPARPAPAAAGRRPAT
ncbi:MULTISPECIES: GntR family transcriptional regulator [Streptomycetaceae]|nr:MULTISPECIES: GntR family transcriptional regulator [Streptomycetaceae]MYS59214.1 GntR family transcriptional regulator [Streptomyces sp. SID5468]